VTLSGSTPRARAVATASERLNPPAQSQTTSSGAVQLLENAAMARATFSAHGAGAEINTGTLDWAAT
jgi:hypothetical protein